MECTKISCAHQPRLRLSFVSTWTTSVCAIAAVVGFVLVLLRPAPPAVAAVSFVSPSGLSNPTITIMLANSSPPVALAIAGVSAETVGSLLESIASSDSVLTAMMLAREEHSLALSADANARSAIRAGGLTPERGDALDIARTRLAEQVILIDEAEEDLRNVVLAAMIDRVGADNAALAARVASNHSRRVPDAWKVLNLPQDSPAWRTLESAWLKAQRGLPDLAFTQAERDALAAAQSSPTVIIAQQRLDAHIAGVEAAWSQFVAEHTQEQDPM